MVQNAKQSQMAQNGPNGQTWSFPDLSNQATFEIATKLRQVQYILNQSEIIYLRGSDEN